MKQIIYSPSIYFNFYNQMGINDLDANDSYETSYQIILSRFQKLLGKVSD